MKQSYEFVFVLQDQLEDMQKTLKSIIAKQGGEVSEEKSWGQKHLAYPMRKKMTGEFFEWAIQMEPAALNEFKKLLSFEQGLVRYLLLKKE